MKSKRKFDKKVVQQFFIDHAEKIVIGAVGLVFLYFAYGAVMLQVDDSFKKGPKDLGDVVTKAQAAMQQPPAPGQLDKDFPVPPIAEKIEQFKAPLALKEFPFDKPVVIAYVGKPHLRGTPEVIAVKGLRAIPGRGAFVGMDSTTSTVGQRWVVVTGLVPYEDQLAEYKKKFQDAGVVGDHDTPEYVGFVVQRAEVVPGAAGEPNWDKAMMFCTQATFDNQLSKWSKNNGTEVVDAEYVQPSLTSPLPPLTITEWGDEVACPPDIKVLSAEERGQTPAQGAFGQGGPPPVGPNGAGGIVPGRRIAGPRRWPGGGPGPGPGFQNNGAGQQPAGNQGGHGLIKGPANVKPDAVATKAGELQKYYLLRYFDFSVEPGKQYAYRVFPMLSNPNFGMNDQLVDDKESSQQFLALSTGNAQADADGKVAGWTVTGNWSPKCQSTKVPGDLRLLAGPAEPPKKPAPAEITGEARFLLWDQNSGDSMHGAKSELFRGTVLDFSSVEMISQVARERKSRQISTGCLLADLSGGDPLSPGDKDKVHSPGTMLVLDENGNLVIHDEMSETNEWIAQTKEPDRTPQERGIGPQPRRGYEGGPGRGSGSHRLPTIHPRGQGFGPPPADPSLPNNMR